MFRLLIKALRLATFTLAPAVAGWFLVYIIHHPWVNHHTMASWWPPILNWVVFGIACIVTITGYVLDIREYCNDKTSRTQSRTFVRRLDTARPQTGRRITDKQ